MGSLGDSYQNNALDALLGAGFTKPATVYVALYTVAPTSIGGGTEVATGSYARVSMTNNTTNWPNAVSGSKGNGTVINFPTASANWGTIIAFALHDSPTADSIIAWGVLSAGESVLTGDSATFNIGALVITAS